MGQQLGEGDQQHEKPQSAAEERAVSLTNYLNGKCLTDVFLANFSEEILLNALCTLRIAVLLIISSKMLQNPYILMPAGSSAACGKQTRIETT